VRAFFMVSQALMPKRCNVLLETVKESPPLQVLEKNGVGLCHDPSANTQNTCRSEPARDGFFMFKLQLTDTPLSRTGSLLQGNVREVAT
jgi:hypothetical protein